MIKLSKRLQSAADMVTEGKTAADIGTDHGYLPIYLIQNKKMQKAIAMDINQGPLNKALENIHRSGLQDKIQIRLSDGLSRLQAGEADTITICGMGGRLIANILENGKSKILPGTELILSPQSEIEWFREYLFNNGYIINREDMIREDGKYYIIIRAALGGSTKQYEKVHFKYGFCLLEQRNAILKEYLIKERLKLIEIKEKAENSTSETAKIRIKEIDEELQCIKKGLESYEM